MHLPLDVNGFCPLEQGESARVCVIRPEWREVDVKAGPKSQERLLFGDKRNLHGGDIWSPSGPAAKNKVSALTGTAGDQHPYN
jgi:hypothetical protein